MKSFIIAGRLIRQINGDKRTLVIMILAPVLIMTLLYFLLASGITTVYIDVVGNDQTDVSALETLAEVHIVPSESEAKARLEEEKSDGYISGDKYVIEGTDPAINALAQRAFIVYTAQQHLGSLPPQAAGLAQAMSVGVDAETYFGSSDYEQFDFLAPSMMAFIIFFLVFLLAGIAFLRERISGTLERVMASSLRRSELVSGYFLGFGLFAAIQTVVIQVYLTYVLGIHTDTDFFLVLLTNLVIAGTSLALGTLLSAFARNEFQLFQFIPVVIIPQVMFCGLFNLRETPVVLQYLAKIFPLSYGADALRNVMLRGRGIGYIWPDLLVMLGFTTLFFVLNIRALKKYRSI
jgi:ABC-2 type transport system permease protein